MGIERVKDRGEKKRGNGVECEKNDGGIQEDGGRKTERENLRGEIGRGKSERMRE